MQMQKQERIITIMPKQPKQPRARAGLPNGGQFVLWNRTPIADDEIIYSEWRKHNFDREEYEAWHNADFSLFEALEWRGNNFTPADAREWNDYLSADKAAAWRNAGFDHKEAMEWDTKCGIMDDGDYSITPEEAQKWSASVSGPDEAIRWILRFGFDPDSSFEWRYYKFTVEEAEEWSAFKFDPEEAQKWREFDPRTACAKLDAKTRKDSNG
jgi:hypothetical protein